MSVARVLSSVVSESQRLPFSIIQMQCACMISFSQILSAVILFLAGIGIGYVVFHPKGLTKHDDGRGFGIVSLSNANISSKIVGSPEELRDKTGADSTKCSIVANAPTQPSVSTQETKGTVINYEYFYSLMNDEALVQGLFDRQMDRYRHHYFPLFRQLKLTEAQVESACRILSDKYISKIDLGATTRGERGSPAVALIAKKFDDEADDRLKNVIGEAAAEQLFSFDRDNWAYKKVESLQYRLAFSSEPLTESQSAALSALFRHNRPMFGANYDKTLETKFRGILTGQQYDRFQDWLRRQQQQATVERRHDSSKR